MPLYPSTCAKLLPSTPMPPSKWTGIHLLLVVCTLHIHVRLKAFSNIAWESMRDLYRRVRMTSYRTCNYCLRVITWRYALQHCSGAATAQWNNDRGSPDCALSFGGPAVVTRCSLQLRAMLLFRHLPDTFRTFCVYQLKARISLSCRLRSQVTAQNGNV